MRDFIRETLGNETNLLLREGCFTIYRVTYTILWLRLTEGASDGRGTEFDVAFAVDGVLLAGG